VCENEINHHRATLVSFHDTSTDTYLKGLWLAPVPEIDKLNFIQLYRLLDRSHSRASTLQGTRGLDVWIERGTTGHRDRRLEQLRNSPR